MIIKELKLIIDFLPNLITRENELEVAGKLNRLDWPIRCNMDLLYDEFIIIHIGLYAKFSNKYIFGKKQVKELQDYIENHFKNDLHFNITKCRTSPDKYQLSFTIHL